MCLNILMLQMKEQVKFAEFEKQPRVSSTLFFQLTLVEAPARSWVFGGGRIRLLIIEHVLSLNNFQ